MAEEGSVMYVKATRKNSVTLATTMILVSACVSYTGAAKSHWDEQVKALCAKDGGVTVYQKVHISTADINRHVLPMTADGKLGFTAKELAHPDAPIYSVDRITTLKEGNPTLRRIESIIVRRSDGAVVARWVNYARLGGEPPIGLSDGTSFICPDVRKMSTDLHEQLFVIDGNPK